MAHGGHVICLVVEAAVSRHREGPAVPSCSIQFMIGGASWTWWIGFHVAVLALLVIDSVLPGTRRESKRTQTTAWVWTAVLAVCAAGFAGWIAVAQGRVPALQ